MKIVGIICEYNPFHLGHEKQIRLIREQTSGDCAIVCLMSGSFVQRGAPAVFDKSLRAQAAVLSGADLVLELPVTYALSSAEGFAAGGVEILGKFCDALCFGTESGTKESLMAAAEALLSPTFSDALRKDLDTGKSFPAARQAAMGEMGVLLERPNDILAVEYCKAVLRSGCSLEPLPIVRQGNYHASVPDAENPSATALRQSILSGGCWTPYIPANAQALFRDAPLHTLQAGERAILARLRSMADAEFEVLPYGSEGLWRKFMHACRSQSSVEQILTATKSKRYTRSRLDRMLMCAFLGISREMMDAPAPYTRVLALSERGREVLKSARHTGLFPHTGEAVDDPYWDLEQRCGDLYGLFRTDCPDPAGLESKRRVSVSKEAAVTAASPTQIPEIP